MTRVPTVSTQLNLIIPGKAKNIQATEKQDRVFHIIGMIIAYALIVIGAVFVIFPFSYMIFGSFMSEEEMSAGQLFPSQGDYWEQVADNYTNTLARFNYGRYVGNTLVVGLSTTCLSLLITILSAFAFARLKFRGRDVLFGAFLATMMIPGEMMVITNYITMSNLGFIGAKQTTAQAYATMILPFLASVFYIYLLRQNFKQIPNELYLAAKVDGKSDWQYLWKVMVPLAMPTLITIFILNLIGSWNAYVWPNLVVANSKNWLISVAIRGEALTKQMPDETLRTQYTWQMCASVLTIVPLFTLFIIFRKYIMKGTGRAGIKG
ncbi:MAG: carbohydrate ABC transporter permease [Bacilli bacterium]|jgi:multiple sugar transport system permease protein|nr:carbohydrate ABC transporter permease [Bacilli bacterium]